AYGTHKDNSQDALRHDTLPKGETHFKSTLTNEQVIELREKFAGGASTHELCENFEASYQVIINAITGRTYAHLPNAQKIYDYDEDKIVALVKMGYAMTAISDWCGASPRNVGYIFEKHTGM